MPLKSIPETPMRRDISTDSAYTIHRKILFFDIAVNRLKLIGLNLSKVMMDLREEGDNYKLMYDDCKLLQILAEDLNECVIFMNNEILNQN